MKKRPPEADWLEGIWVVIWVALIVWFILLFIEGMNAWPAEFTDSWECRFGICFVSLFIVKWIGIIFLGHDKPTPWR
jgi:hypothetical protein